MRTAYVPGVYDMFHVGHLNLLRQARQHCDWLIAGVVSDEIAERAKGKTPVIPTQERLDIISSNRLVDLAVVENTDKLTMWSRLGFDLIVKGDDWCGTAKGYKLERDCLSVGVHVVYVPYTADTSSTLLRQALHDRVSA